MSTTLTRAPGVVGGVPLEISPHDPPLAGWPTEVLLRAVIARARAVTPLDGEPLLDMTVDGVRCALTAEQPSRADALSPREREIAGMVARGYTNKMIASVLDISLWTVSTHLRRIFAKLGVSTRAAMVALVMER
jgi:DNA-binding CsgD family transcriptional regulator